ncbi:MAG: hypothetical protein RR224_11270, partial [Clostridia bacterium]
EVFIAKDWGHQRNYSESLAATVDDEVRKILDEQYERAKTAISTNMEALDRVANMLIEYERVTGEEFDQVYQGADPVEVIEKRKKAAAKRAEEQNAESAAEKATQTPKTPVESGDSAEHVSEENKQ